MKHFKIFLSIIIMLATSHTFALFSPYADLTVNTHWDPNYQDMEPQDLSKISEDSGIKAYHLAFITDSGTCQPAWGGQSSYAVSANWGNHLLDKLRASHIDYVISFGGANGNDLSLACSESQLIEAYENIIQVYQPQGLDFDIENGTANVDKLMQALQKIQSAHPQLKMSFTLPVLPEGLTYTGEDIVKKAKAAQLHYSVNIMAMDYGPAYSKDMGEYAIEAATHLFSFLKTLYPEKSEAQLWQMIALTPMIGVNDTNIEKFTLADVDLLRDFDTKNNLNSLSMWSVSRDNPCPDQWASPICSGDNLQSTPYEFAKRFSTTLRKNAKKS